MSAVANSRNRTFHGIGVSPGVAAGPALLLFPDVLQVSERSIQAADVPGEIVRFEDALIETRGQIQQIQDAMSGQTRAQDASILDAHLMVLDDRTFIEEVIGWVREKLRNIEYAVQEGTNKYASVLEAVEDDYLRERVADVRDVGRRILRNLTGRAADSTFSMAAGHLIVAHDLAPSETASLPKDKILGFATDLGSPTSHTAVMARALELPAVVGLHDVSRHIHPGDHVLIDGNKGVFILNPDEEQLKTYGKLAEVRRSIEAGLVNLQHEPAITKDGRAIVLAANAEGPEDVDAILQYGARGIGLLRSEFLHLTRNRLLSEEEQGDVYTRIAARLAPDPVIIRTLDLGGDKFFGDVRGAKELNPFLGLRSIRLSLRHPDYFKQQLRAILRASVHGNVRLMYPMISSVGEILQANQHLRDAMGELTSIGVVFDRDIQIGAMIEVPAAALAAHIIAKHVDFLSIGTNDLIQYTMAVDRGNERVAYLYEPTHPSVLALIDMTVKAAHAQGIWVGLCGQMAADPLMTALLLGLGIDELSVSPRAVPLVKDALRSLHFGQASELAREALACETADEVLEKCRRLTR
ncbi:MAG TPA: phosphoenolpyruvate--protein phosphotransferase, partial [Verrucomicrobia bacterium]|nr:phosphoenolpyruvate--protein phosphotransferase [Verrucomicrobiota bacterium]